MSATSKEFVQLTIDSKEIKSLSKEDRKALAEDIVDYIRKNAERGKGAPTSIDSPEVISRYRTFKKYTEIYEKSLDFKIAGKNKGQTPDMTLSGDMLAELDVIDVKKDKIIIGYDPSSENAGKAEGNIRGTYGQSGNGNPKVRKNFLTISKSDLNRLIKKYEE